MPAKNPFPPTSERTNTYTAAADKFVRAGISDHNSLTLQRFAALRSCHVGRAWHLQFSLQAACQADPACADGRLPSDDASALMIGGPIHDLGDANEVLRDALDAGLVARRHGHLHLVGFKRRYPVPQAHARAPAARAKRDRDANRLRANAYQRDYVVRRKAKLAEIRAAERMPLAPPQQPLRQVWPVPPSRAHQPVHLSKASSPPHFDPASVPTEPAISAITRHQKAQSGTSPSEAPQLPDPSHVHLTLISAPPTDAFCGTSGGDSGHRPCLKSLAPLPDRNKLHNPPPAASLVEDQGDKHVCQNQGDKGEAPRPAGQSRQPAQPTCTLHKQPSLRPNQPMQPPDNLDEGYLRSLLGRADAPPAPRPCPSAPTSAPQGHAPAMIVPKATQAPLARPAPAVAQQRMAPADHWRDRSTATAPGQHRVVSASTPPSQVRHTTPSPEATPEESQMAATESIEAAKSNAWVISEEQANERLIQSKKIEEAFREISLRLGWARREK